MVADDLPQLQEQFGRDNTIEWRVAVRHRPHVRAGPRKAVELGSDDPAPSVVQPQMLFHARRDFDTVTRWRLPVGDRRNEEFGPVAGNDPRDTDDDRAVLKSFLLTRFRFLSPQIGVGQDVSRFGNRP